MNPPLTQKIKAARPFLFVWEFRKDLIYPQLTPIHENMPLQDHQTESCCPGKLPGMIRLFGIKIATIKIDGCYFYNYLYG